MWFVMPMPVIASRASAVLAPVTTASFDVRAKRSTAATAPGSGRNPEAAIRARFSSTASAISWVIVTGSSWLRAIIP